MSRSIANASSLVRFALYYSGGNDRKVVYLILANLGLSWILNEIYFALLGGILGFGLFLMGLINQMKNNAREFESKNPDYDPDSEIYTRGMLLQGYFLFLFGLPFTYIGGTLLSSTNYSEQWIDVQVGLFEVILVFWQIFGHLAFFFLGLGISCMGLYTCYDYLKNG